MIIDAQYVECCDGCARILREVRIRYREHLEPEPGPLYSTVANFGLLTLAGCLSDPQIGVFDLYTLLNSLTRPECLPPLISLESPDDRCVVICVSLLRIPHQGLPLSTANATAGPPAKRVCQFSNIHGRKTVRVVSLGSPTLHPIGHLVWHVPSSYLTSSC